MSARPEPEFGLGKSIAYSMILIALVLGVAEAGVRGWAYFLRDDAEKWDPATSTFVLVPGRHRSQFTTVMVNRDGFVGAELEEPGEDLWRIVAVGDSCTFGEGDDETTYPAMLDARLRSLEGPGRRIEVVNAGISGLNSELALRRLESVVPALEPDVVTLYIGWNDLMKHDPLGQGGTGRLSGVARVLDRLWLAKGLRKLIFFHLRPRLRPPLTGPESRSGRFADFTPRIYQDNLKAMIETVRGMGAQPVLVTLPTVVRPEMDADDLIRARVMFPYFPSAYAVGDFLDLLEAYNREIRRVGEETDVPVIDVARDFEALPDTRPFFFDTMHTNSKGMAIIARSLEEGLRRRDLLGGSSLAASDGGSG